MSVTHGRGAVLLRCHAGCATAAVVAALGLREADLFDRDDLAPAVGAEPTRDFVDPGVLAAWRDQCVEALCSSKAAGPARSWLRARGVDGDLVRRYQLGFGIGHEDRRLGALRGRVTVCVWPHGAEGRAVDGAACWRPELRWLTAKGSTKRAWRADDVDPTSPVVLVEGAFDVLGLDRIAPGQGVALRGKRLRDEDARLLARRGVSTALVSLDRDAGAEDWRGVFVALAAARVRGVPAVGPPDDFGALLPLPDHDYYPLASEALAEEVGR